MIKLKRILLASILFYTPVYAAENAFEYSAVTLSYARELSTPYQQEPQHLSADLSIEVSAHGFIYTGIQSGWVKCTQQINNHSVELDIVTNSTQFGYGHHRSLSHRSDLYGRLGLLINKTTTDVIARTDTSINTASDHSSALGMDSEIGLRQFINSNRNIELTPSLQFSHIYSEPHTKLGIAISYHLNDIVQIQTGYLYELDSETQSLSLNFRLYGKSF